MKYLSDISELETIYGVAVPASKSKVADHLTPEYHRWIENSKFCVLSTVGPEGTDGTPRGDDGPVVRIENAKTLMMPDWAGNNRIDSLRNILRDPRCSLMFMVQGSTTVVRVNGQARITDDANLRASFMRKSMQPRAVVEVVIDEVYFQCSKAMMRSRFWDGRPDISDLPTAGDFLRAMTGGKQGGAAYDAAYPERAKTQLWERDYD